MGAVEPYDHDPTLAVPEPTSERSFGAKFSPAQGADTIVWLAGQSRDAVAQGGYYTKCALAEPNPLAEDEELAKSLWERSEVLAGVVTAT
jgi:hypothetical protein